MSGMRACATPFACTAASLFASPPPGAFVPAFVAIEYRGQMGNNIGQYFIARYFAEALNVPLVV